MSHPMMPIMQKANMSNNGKSLPLHPIQHTSNLNKISHQQTSALPQAPSRPTTSLLHQAKILQGLLATKQLKIKTRCCLNYQAAPPRIIHRVKVGRASSTSRRRHSTKEVVSIMSLAGTLCRVGFKEDRLVAQAWQG